ncbi:alpha-ketoacid dehydrogenase subunit beta, partial [Enterobacter quasiroggenkampii]|nr:alpha-ketoacid dehydrogenase subunit beta [Enterobacter quasiroggenkampii]
MSRNLTILQAINEALDQKLADDQRVMLTGEDIGVNGGVFRATEGLFEKYGQERVVDTPLAEAGIIGSAIGLALNGFIPVVEIQFLAFIYPGFE